MKSKYLTGALITAILVISAYYFPKSNNNNKISSQITTTTVPAVIVSTSTASNVVAVVSSTAPLSLSDIKTLSNPSIGKVDYYPVQNSQGTVILIPQEHQNPGTDPTDPVNDLAVKTQKEIYQILGDLTGKLNISTVMAEGDMFGEVPQKKIAYLANLLVQKNQLSSRIDLLQKDNNQVIYPLLGHLKTYLNSIDREITLTGAPYDLKAEGNSLVIYGIENKNTFDQSAELVRNYVYLLDRKQQLTSGSTVKTTAGGLSKAFVMPTLSYNPALAIEQEISLLPSFVLSQSTKNTLGDVSAILTNIEQLRTTQNSSATPLPSRTNNPYLKIRSAKEIDKLLQKNSEDIQHTIIDQRNVDTAANCLQIMTEKNIPALILQLGAGHEQGIVKELNSKGLSVIVVTPHSVLKS